ncbi:hypothetical protein [Sulfurirhabdus autotrophica]|uniref:Uncharacterized protein n=1 Tax=Sulfurirhabdus autotrophica TaxID=1706046 RepID=A0A4R3Y779_9PROT|nr:hypothetical protein [Sulfurirhabdus autotrophica]TCV87482.1 hypothetical protein EDC63_105151 [Sulfurirhabdus autotrophica]
MTHSVLHPSIVALVSLASNIAANHPNQGLCQLDKLKEFGVSEEQIDLVVEIARHIRDESAKKLDDKFDQAFKACFPPEGGETLSTIPVAGGACCTPTPSGKSCC